MNRSYYLKTIVYVSSLNIYLWEISMTSNQELIKRAKVKLVLLANFVYQSDLVQIKINSQSLCFIF